MLYFFSILYCIFLLAPSTSLAVPGPGQSLYQRSPDPVIWDNEIGRFVRFEGLDKKIGKSKTSRCESVGMERTFLKYFKPKKDNSYADIKLNNGQTLRINKGALFVKYDKEQSWILIANRTFDSSDLEDSNSNLFIRIDFERFENLNLGELVDINEKSEILIYEGDYVRDSFHFRFDEKNQYLIMAKCRKDYYMVLYNNLRTNEYRLVPINAESEFSYKMEVVEGLVQYHNPQNENKPRNSFKDLDKIDLEGLLKEEYSDLLSNGKAVALDKKVVGVYNEKINYKAEIEKNKKRREVIRELENSKNYYTCVDNNLPAYKNSALEGESSLTIPRSEALDLTEEAPVEIKEGSIIETNVQVRYEGELYWVRKSVEDTSRKTRAEYVSKFSDCPHIQEELIEKQLELGSDTEDQVRTSTLVTFSKFICTSNVDGVVNGRKGKELKVDSTLPNGQEVGLVQNSNYPPIQDRGYNYVAVKYNKVDYPLYVADEFLKDFSDCPSIQYEVVKACTKSSLNFYESDENILKRESQGQFNAFQNVFRVMGDLYSKKALLIEGKIVEYVPVKTGQYNPETYWTALDYVTGECDIDPNEKIGYISSKGVKCRVQAEDNFPFTVPARNNYYSKKGTAWYGACRDRDKNNVCQRRHKAVDLFSYRLGSPKVHEKYGLDVYAIEDGKALVGSFGGGDYLTSRILVQSKSGYTWNYAEVGRVKIGNGTYISRGQQIATAKKFASGKSYPPMLHLEKYSRYVNSPAQSSPYIMNPSCHIEYMESKKFPNLVR